MSRSGFREPERAARGDERRRSRRTRATRRRGRCARRTRRSPPTPSAGRLGLRHRRLRRARPSLAPRDARVAPASTASGRIRYVEPRDLDRGGRRPAVPTGEHRGARSSTTSSTASSSRSTRSTSSDCSAPCTSGYDTLERAPTRWAPMTAETKLEQDPHPRRPDGRQLNPWALLEPVEVGGVTVSTAPRCTTRRTSTARTSARATRVDRPAGRAT